MAGPPRAPSGLLGETVKTLRFGAAAIALTGTLLVFGATRADAALIYSCPGGDSECAGQTFALGITDPGDGTFFDITFSINTTGYNGPAGAGAWGVEFKNIIDDSVQYSSIALTSVPDGNLSNWGAFTDQLSQDCVANDPNPGDLGCGIWTAGGVGYLFTPGEILDWVFRVTTNSPVGDSVGHIKYSYLYVGSNGKLKKAAGLLSADVPLGMDGGQDGGGGVPEPATLLLFGMGLGVASRRLRKRRPNQ